MPQILTISVHYTPTDYQWGVVQCDSIDMVFRYWRKNSIVLFSDGFYQTHDRAIQALALAFPQTAIAVIGKIENSSIANLQFIEEAEIEEFLRAAICKQHQPSVAAESAKQIWDLF